MIAEHLVAICGRGYALAARECKGAGDLAPQPIARGGWLRAADGSALGIHTGIAAEAYPLPCRASTLLQRAPPCAVQVPA